MEINGLPLHPLVVHAAVVLAPIACLVALAYLVPAWRERLRTAMVVLAVIAGVAVVVAYLSGDHFKGANPQAFDSPEVQPLYDRVHDHEQLAQKLLWSTVGFAVVAVVQGWFHSRTGSVRLVLNVLLAAAALATLVLVFLTGEAGAKATWDGFQG